MSARILIIEDNPTNMELMVYLLRAFGYTPLSASDGEEGVATARREKPDLIICDVQLPGMDGYAVAAALEKAALDELHARRPDRVLATNVEFWAAIVLDFAEVPAHMFTSMFTCARTAGWSAHILEQKRTGRLVRPSARYIGPGTRSPHEVDGFDDIAR